MIVINKSRNKEKDKLFEANKLTPILHSVVRPLCLSCTREARLKDTNRFNINGKNISFAYNETILAKVWIILSTLLQTQQKDKDPKYDCNHKQSWMILPNLVSMLWETGFALITINQSDSITTRFKWTHLSQGTLEWQLPRAIKVQSVLPSAQWSFEAQAHTSLV